MGPRRFGKIHMTLRNSIGQPLTLGGGEAPSRGEYRGLAVPQAPHREQQDTRTDG